MNKKQFWNNLKIFSNYKTQKKKYSFLWYIPGWITFSFYIKFLIIILNKSIMARKGMFDIHSFSGTSMEIISLIESIGGEIYISGLEELAKQKGPVVYVVNHMSMIDTLILPGITLAFSNIAFVLKKELLQYPFFGIILKRIDHIAITRQNPREDFRKVINEGCELISKKDCSIILFPQTTRSINWNTASFNSLGVKLAKKAGIPVVPVALKTDFLSNGKLIKEIGTINIKKKIYIKFGKSLTVERKDDKTHQKTIDFISRNLKEWGCSTD